ncbi:hypothetical protein ACI2L1_38715 [Streptomyces sp. NPDC019531]|uniref:hypothetical protein n=1 Tax=Streptomyces sp. NPDC019531 TaxID=3365062 RepID=UPI00384F6234
MYYENSHVPDWFPTSTSGVPTAVANFGEDVVIRRWAEQANTVVRWTEVDRGGHFAPWRSPSCWQATSASSSAHCRDGHRHTVAHC